MFPTSNDPKIRLLSRERVKIKARVNEDVIAEKAFRRPFHGVIRRLGNVAIPARNTVSFVGINRYPISNDVKKKLKSAQIMDWKLEIPGERFSS